MKTKTFSKIFFKTTNEQIRYKRNKSHGTLCHLEYGFVTPKRLWSKKYVEAIATFWKQSLSLEKLTEQFH